jgi:hypothetical protein
VTTHLAFRKTGTYCAPLRKYKKPPKTTEEPEQITCKECLRKHLWYVKRLARTQRELEQESETRATGLLPCPCCGGAAKMCGRLGNFYVRCDKCLLGHDFREPEEARRAWNNRRGG